MRHGLQSLRVSKLEIWYLDGDGRSRDLKDVAEVLQSNGRLAVSVSVRDELINCLYLESPAPMPDKIFRLRTGPEKKMDAFGQDGQLLSPRFVKTRPADGALGPEQFDVDYFKFED